MQVMWEISGVDETEEGIRDSGAKGGVDFLLLTRRGAGSKEQSLILKRLSRTDSDNYYDNDNDNAPWKIPRGHCIEWSQTGRQNSDDRRLVKRPGGVKGDWG